MVTTDSTLGTFPLDLHPDVSPRWGFVMPNQVCVTQIVTAVAIKNVSYKTLKMLLNG